MHEVKFHPKAFDELQNAVIWYEEQAADLGGRFFTEIENAVNSIIKYPHAWPAVENDTRRYLLHHFPFAVIYRHSREIIHVVAVMHLKRRPGYWKKRK